MGYTGGTLKDPTYHNLGDHTTTEDAVLSTPPALGPTRGVTAAAYTNNDLNPDTATTLFDMMALAFEADLTRVFSFMLNREASQLVFPGLGFNEPWHHVSHHGNDPDKLALLVKLNTWQIGIFGRFLDTLHATPDGDGTLLDHSCLLWGSGMGDSNSHSPLDVPYLMVGKGGGAFTGRGHVVAPKGTQLANLMLTVGQRYGLESDTFGVSTGAFAF